MNLLPLPSASPDMPQTDAPAAPQAEGRPRRFARLLEAALALFFPGDENPAASASSENSALSGHEILSKTPEESPSSSSTPTGEKHHPPRDRKSPQSASLAPEVASALSAMATAAPPTISPPETSVSSSHPTTLSEKTTAPADRIGTVLIPRAETNANGSAQTALPSSIEPDESTLSERAPGETHPATPDVRSAAFHGSQSMEAEATPETPVPSDGARLTQATSAQTRHEVAPRPLNQAEMQRPPAMTPESASAPAQAKHTPAPVVPELAAHVAQQSGAAPDSDRAPTYQDRFVENGSSTSHRGVDLETAFGIRPVHLQTNSEAVNQETTATALPESRSASSMPAETAPQGKPASESRPLLSLTTEASEPVNVSAPTPTETEAAPATTVRQKNPVAQKQALPESSYDDPPATAGTPAQQTADNPTPQSSELPSLVVSSEVSHAHPSGKATDRAEAATGPDHRPAKPAATPAQPSAGNPTPQSSELPSLAVSSEVSHAHPAGKATDRAEAATGPEHRPAHPSAPEPNASTRKANPTFKQSPESDPAREVRRTPEQIAHPSTTSRATDRAEAATGPDHSPAKPAATPAQPSAGNPTPQSSELPSLAVSSEVSHAHPAGKATDRAEAATGPEHRPAHPSTPEPNPAFRKSPESDSAREVRRTPEQIAHPSSTSRATDRAEAATGPEHRPAHPSTPEPNPAFRKSPESDSAREVRRTPEQIAHPSSTSRATDRAETATGPDHSPAKPAATPAQQTAGNPTPQSSELPSLAVSSEVSHAHPSGKATDRAEAATGPDHSPAKPAAPEPNPAFRKSPESDSAREVRRTPEQIAHPSSTSRATDRAETTTEPEHSPAKPSAPESDASTREADPAFRQDFETDPSREVQLAAEEIDRSLNASPSTPTPSPQATALPRVIRTAAWFQMAMAFAERVRQHVDGQMLEVELADGEGTLRVETRRHPDHVAVSVQLSDPQLRALVAAHADRIQEALQAQYQTAVQFSLSGGGEQGARQQQAFAQAPTHGTPLASGSDTSGSTPVESSRARVLHPGSRHEWIG